MNWAAWIVIGMAAVSAGFFVLTLCGMAWAVWADRRFHRATEQALAVTRHPSNGVPFEDSPEWAQRWGLPR